MYYILDQSNDDAVKRLILNDEPSGYNHQEVIVGWLIEGTLCHTAVQSPSKRHWFGESCAIFEKRKHYEDSQSQIR